MIEFANGLDRLLQILVILQPATHFGNAFATHAQLARSSTGISHRQNEDLVTFAALALRTAALVANQPFQEGATQKLAGDRQLVE